MGKEIERQVHDGEIVEEEEESRGIPAGDRGPRNGNNGMDIRDWRAGQGPTR